MRVACRLSVPPPPLLLTSQVAPTAQRHAQSGIPHSHAMLCIPQPPPSHSNSFPPSSFTHGGEGRGRVFNMGVSICFPTHPRHFPLIPPHPIPPRPYWGPSSSPHIPCIGGRRHCVIVRSNPFRCRPLPLPGRRSARRSVQTRSSSCGCSGSLAGAGGERARGGGGCGSKDYGKYIEG